MCRVKLAAWSVPVFVIILVASVANSAPSFTGDVSTDFTDSLTEVVPDPGLIDVGVPTLFPPGTISGNDMADARFYLDHGTDTLYVGLGMYSIAGDVDGDGDPGGTSDVLASLGGVDLPDFAGTESFSVMFDIDQDGTFDVIAGVSGRTDTNHFSVNVFDGSPYAPAFAYGTALLSHVGALYASPHAGAPDVEFTILHFSDLPLSSGSDWAPTLGVNTFVGSFSDDGVGEDYIPGANLPAEICLSRDTDGDGIKDCYDFERCDGLDNNGNGLIDEGYDADSDGIADCFDTEECDGLDNDGDGFIDEDFDVDGDSVPDCFDGCTDDPTKAEPGICGCGVPDVDTDGDEVYDCNEICIEDAHKTDPGVCGCGVADTDSDGDSTADCDDECFEDPGKVKAGECGCGIADTDTDGDGIADCNDVEVCDGLDNDGDGEIDEGFDSDDDGIADCFDEEECDGRDNNGNGLIDEGFDSDGDGTADCIDECDDDPHKVTPGICGCGVAEDDSDGDETVDCIDYCPDDPLKVDPGECGCDVLDTDSDGDHVADCDDECDDDPLKVEPGDCGCGIADTDSDGDTVADCIDECDDDPFKVEEGVCGCGVADVDSDGDYVWDCDDECDDDPMKIEPGVCGCGLSDIDTDGDGVPDCVDDACPPTIDFDTDAYGEPILPGQDLSEAYAPYGVHMTVWDDSSMSTMGMGIAFDSSNPTGGDYDLGTPNEAFGGPGVGSGGTTTNNLSLGNLLISAENFVDADGDGYVDVPDDDGSGAYILFEFDVPTCVEMIDLVDVDLSEGPTTLDFYNGVFTLIESIDAPAIGHNGFQRLELGVCNVSYFSVSFRGSGGVDNLTVCPSEADCSCTGGIAKLLVEYSGPEHAHINVFGGDWDPREREPLMIFEDVNPGDLLFVDATIGGYTTLGPITFFQVISTRCNRTVEINTSCDQAIEGKTFSVFTVLSYEDETGLYCEDKPEEPVDPEPS